MSGEGREQLLKVLYSLSSTQAAAEPEYVESQPDSSTEEEFQPDRTDEVLAAISALRLQTTRVTIIFAVAAWLLLMGEAWLLLR